MTKKRIFTVLLVVTMCVSMALPTFAASWTTPGGIYSNISGTSSTYLNLEGEGKAYNHRNVTRASASTSLDQDWYIRISSIDDGYKVYALPQNAETGNVNLIWYDDGNLLLSYSLEGENTPHFVVFEEKTGRFSECGLHYHANDRELPVCVVGEIPAQDSYLVLCDEVTVDSVSNLYSGARTAPVYAQIKKEEYWAGNNRNQRRCTGA